MKKIVFSLAVISIAAMMVSCSGNKTNAGEDTDSVIIEVEELSGQTVDAGDFTIVIPDGWELEGIASSYVRIKKDMGDNPPKQLLFLPYPVTPNSAEDKRNEKLAFKIDKGLDPVTLAGKTWHALYKAPQGDDRGYYYYYVDMPKGGFLNVQDINGYGGTNDPEIKEILESIKFK